MCTLSDRAQSALAAILLIAAVLAAGGSILAVHLALRAPAWCDYPAPAAVVALDAHVADQLAGIHRYSPDVRGDVLTLQAAALAECGPFTG
jgi:hypothetical protein